MKPSLTDMLCTRCGLCCDGSLFADVELAGGDEAASLEVMGLEIEEEELLLQPCAALQGKRCGIYAYRPECCRTFECRLLQDARRGAISVARAGELIAETLQQVEQVRELSSSLGQRDVRLPLAERCAEALALADEAGAVRQCAELAAAMKAVEGLIRKTFLRSGGGTVMNHQGTKDTKPEKSW